MKVNELVCQNNRVLEIEMHAMMEFVKSLRIGSLPNLLSSIIGGRVGGWVGGRVGLGHALIGTS